MENKIRELCEKIDNLRVGEEFRVKDHCEEIACGECPFKRTFCGYITGETFETYQAIARKWLENNKSTEQRKFKVGDKVVLSSGEKWGRNTKYKTVLEILNCGYRLTATESIGESFFPWGDSGLELYTEKEQPKTYNIIEALKLPAGTKLKITFSDGSESRGYVEKYGEEEEDCNCLKLLPSKRNVDITGYYINATYTVIEEQKPISFFEAVQQADKKRFRIEHELYKESEYFTLERHMFNLYEDFYSIDMRNIMLNAKCYLED